MTIPFPVLYDEGPLIAFDKPSGLYSIRERKGGEDRSLHALASLREGRRLFVVHRLDKDTSGVLLFARSAAAHRRLSLLFETRQVEKSYLAWILGEPSAEEGVVETPLREFGSGRMGVDPRGKESLTRWRVLRRTPGAALLDVRPETGRRHQIRVHLCSIGHPVLGDRMYGPRRPVGGLPRLMLHAREIVFPWDAPDPIRIDSPAPPEFSVPPSLAVAQGCP